MKYYHNPRCRKSREGLQYLEELNIRPTIIEYLKNPLNKEELKEILKQLKYSPTDLLRKNEIVYKTHIKNKNLSDEDILKWLIDEPKLIERPILSTNKGAKIGRPKENFKEILP